MGLRLGRRGHPAHGGARWCPEVVLLDPHRQAFLTASVSTLAARGPGPHPPSLSTWIPPPLTALRPPPWSLARRVCLTSPPARRGLPSAPTRSVCTAGVLYLHESDPGQLRACQKAALGDTEELPRLVGTFGWGTRMTTLDVSFVQAPAVEDVSVL